MAAAPVFLAWANLAHDRVRLLLFSLGIGFAVLLMFVQAGFKNALLDSNLQLPESLRAELFLVSKARQALMVSAGLPRRRLDAAKAVEGVASVHSFYVDSHLGSLLDTHATLDRRAPTKTIRVIGINPNDYLLDLPELNPANADAVVHRLNVPGSALYDRRTRIGHVNPRTGDIDPSTTVFGPLSDYLDTELSGHDITIVGSFDLGTDFTADGTLIVSEETFDRLLRKPYFFGGTNPDVDYGLVRLTEAGRDDLPRVRQAIQRAMVDNDVDVLTRDELLDRERTFWLKNTPIGFTFGLGVIMGLMVGMVICYQILSSDVADHLSEYATLKAIGYRNVSLVNVVMQEALILAVVGFIPGFIASWGVFAYLGNLTGLPMRLTPDRVATTFAMTVVMCVLPGLISIRTVQQADPADVF